MYDGGRGKRLPRVYASDSEHRPARDDGLWCGSAWPTSSVWRLYHDGAVVMAEMKDLLAVMIPDGWCSRTKDGMLACGRTVGTRDAGGRGDRFCVGTP
jgi:hypothetical protein